MQTPHKVVALIVVVLVGAASSGCEIIRHQQATLRADIAVVSSPGQAGLCDMLEEVAREHGLSAQPPGNASTLCYFKKDLNGFPLILGARVDNGVTLIDVWSWNISAEFRTLEASMIGRLKQQYGDAVSISEKPVPP